MINDMVQVLIYGKFLKPVQEKGLLVKQTYF
jgi:hypothetical protein